MWRELEGVRNLSQQWLKLLLVLQSLPTHTNFLVCVDRSRSSTVFYNRNCEVSKFCQPQNKALGVLSCASF
jgi:hypothetical protein